MKDDPEYRNLIRKQDKQQIEQPFEVVTQDQVEETRGHAREVVHIIQQKIAQEQSNVEDQLNFSMMQLLINKIEVAEVHSPPRVTQVARQMVFGAVWSLDITTCDGDGKAWDSNDVEMRKRAARRVLGDEPLLLVGSPMCIAFGVMNRINYIKMDKEEVAHRLEHGRRHLSFCAKLYAMHWRAGRYFPHEHPEGASSWEEQCIKNLLAKEWGDTRQC